MKITLVFLFICLLTVSANVSYGQNKRFTITVENKTVKNLLEEIEKNSEFIFFYNNDALNMEKHISLSVTDLTIDQLLPKILNKKEASYKVVGNQIIIYKTGKGLDKIEEKMLVSQTKITVSGTVTDQHGDPLIGVNIIEKNTTNGTTTDLDGNYSLKVSNPQAILEFRYVGYVTVEKKLEGKKVIHMILQEDASNLEEVVVVAFGTQKKESVIGSVSTINPGKLKVPSSNLTTALAGNMAGVIAYQRSGEPGKDNADFFVRGITTFGTNTNPLILIDGIELTSTDLARLQPDDIASFSIMKDATATALYGARGANGVILVTTKQGSFGPAKISARVENSISMPTRNIELADPITYMRTNNEAVQTRNPLGSLPYSQEKIDNTIAGIDPIRYPANDWMDMLMKSYTMNQRANLSISGGGGVARYYVAASFSKDNGILKVDKRNNFNSNIDNKTYTLRSNINIDLTKTTEMIVRLSGSFDDYSGPLKGGAETYNMIMHANSVMFPAYYPVDQEHLHTDHILFGNYENQYVNPYAETVRGYKDKSRSQMIAQMVLNQKLDFITKGLSVKGMFNISRLAQFSVNRFYNPYYYQMGSYHVGTKEYSLIQKNEGTEYLDYSEEGGDKITNSTMYFEGTLNYARTFSEAHSVSGLLVYTLHESLNANTGNLQLSLPSRNMGLSGRATYSYDNRYFGEFNFGYNGSERFHKSNRFGFFPSAGVAWLLSNERFFEPVRPIVSKLKFRFSYGLVGNDQIGSSADRFFYLSQVNMSDGNRGATFGQELSQSLPGISISRYANEGITWEISKKKDFAVELGLWDKVNIVAEYFNEYRSNILMERVSIPTTMGLSNNVKANIGEASGSGVDLSMDYNQSWSSKFWTSARANFTYATSKYEVFEEPQYTEPWRYKAGRTLSQQFGYLAERLFVDDAEAANSPKQEIGSSSYGGGDIKYTDVNRDGKITELDMVPIGNPTVPEIVYGFGFSLGYKNVDLSAFFQGSANTSFWIDAGATSPFQGQTQLLKAYADNHWSEENQNVYALWPRLSPTLNENNVKNLSTYFMRDGSFLRFKQLEIGYTLPQMWTKKANVSNLRFYISGTNLLLFSKFKLWDVEMAGNGLGYPLQRVFNIGLNLTIN